LLGRLKDKKRLLGRLKDKKRLLEGAGWMVPLLHPYPLLVYNLDNIKRY
jgi:hypothetical protein